MMLWLDDLRPVPKGWVLARSVEEAIALMKAGGVTHASLDHDLGDYAQHGGDGWRFTRWCLTENVWPSQGMAVHSSSVVGRTNMLADIDDADPYGDGLRGVHTPRLCRGATPTGGWPVPGQYDF